MSDALTAADALARESAVDPRRSVLLQAPAGSGKTAVLTQRFLRLLCTVGEPGEVHDDLPGHDEQGEEVRDAAHEEDGEIVARVLEDFARDEEEDKSADRASHAAEARD